jgi:hypothetical protein
VRHRTAHQAELPIHAMCKHLQVSTSGYYDWAGRAPSARSMANAQLLGKFEAIHALSDATTANAPARYFGALAPNSPLRAAVAVMALPAAAQQASKQAEQATRGEDPPVWSHRAKQAQLSLSLNYGGSTGTAL